MRPVEPRNWDHDKRVIFSNLMEAMSLGICDASSWLQAHRECITVVNHVVSSPNSEEIHSELKSVVASLKAITGGQGWKVQRSLEFRLSSKYWSSAMSDWKSVPGTGLTGGANHEGAYVTSSKPVHCVTSGNGHILSISGDG